MRNPRWRMRLACGHQAASQGRPAPGTWTSCPQPGCRRQERITHVTPVLVQDRLF